MIFNHPPIYNWLGWAIPWNIGVIIVFVLIALSDTIDGFLARALNSVTELGIQLDPLADKLLIVITFVAVCLSGLIVEPWGWSILVLTAAREFGMIVLRWYLQYRNVKVSIPANWDGKIKMWLQCVGLGMTLLLIQGMAWQVAIVTVLIASLYLSYKSAIAYIKVGIAANQAAR